MRNFTGVSVSELKLWSAEVFGGPDVKQRVEIMEKVVKRKAEINGRRGQCSGVWINTNGKGLT
jgi:hypothetical protein